MDRVAVGGMQSSFSKGCILVISDVTDIQLKLNNFFVTRNEIIKY